MSYIRKKFSKNKTSKMSNSAQLIQCIVTDSVKFLNQGTMCSIIIKKHFPNAKPELKFQVIFYL